MANHEIVCGDVFDVLPLQDSNSFHAAIIDYPWKMNIKTASGDVEFRNAPRGADKGCRDEDGDEVMFNIEDDKRLKQLFEYLSDIIVDGGYIICFADDRFQEVVRDELQNSDLIFRRNWAWKPKQFGMGYYGRINHYPMPIATNGETNRYVKDRGTLYEEYKRNENDYPTSKPISLYRDLLASPILEAGERLIEPFCGSAPGLAIAKERELDYLGIDINSDAIDLAQERYNQQTLQDFSSNNTKPKNHQLNTF